MQTEHVFSVQSAAASALTPITLAEAGLLERQHLQEWLLSNPQILGDDVMIVTSEFDRWWTTSGRARRDRLDILAIDTGGRLVVAELKRDTASSDVDLQALKYRGLGFRFTSDTLVEAHCRHLRSREGRPVELSEARNAIEAHLDGPIDPDVWAQPRIVLVANSFPDTVTNTVVWLSEVGLDVALLRYQMYASGNEPILVLNQIYPPPDTDDFLLTPRREEVQQARVRSQDRSRQVDAVKRLVRAGALEAGTPLHLDPSGVNLELREQLLAWIGEEPEHGEAVWTNKESTPLRWSHTGVEGKPSTFASQALMEATGVQRAIAGTRWWRTDEGVSLSELAAELRPTAGRRDWSDLHSVLDALPAGRWTTYGDLAGHIGTAAQPLGLHISSCEDCSNAHRVLKVDGSIAPGFSWSDPAETRAPREMLEAEGLSFDGAGHADSARRLDLSDLDASR